MADEPHDTPNPIARQCTAHSKRTGDRCQRPAIHGATVCYHHGGAAPQVLKKARERILELVDPALLQLSILVEEADSDAVKLSAIRDILDRAGFAAPKKLEVEDVTGKRLLGVPESEV